MGALKSKFRRSKSPKGDKDKGSNKKKKGAPPPGLPESQSARKLVDPRLPFSNYRQIFGIRNAWKAISRTMEECAKETLIRLFRSKPHHRERFSTIKHIVEEDEMRHSEDFETAAMDIYQIFDDVIAELENVDKALKGIQFCAPNSNLTQRMMKDMEVPFIDTIRIYLGSDRFTESTEGNYKLLYQFIQEEVGKYIEEGEVEVQADVITPSETAADAGGDAAVPDANITSESADVKADDTAAVIDTVKDNATQNNNAVDAAVAGETIQSDDSAVVSDTQVEVNLCSDTAT